MTPTCCFDEFAHYNISKGGLVVKFACLMSSCIRTIDQVAMLLQRWNPLLRQCKWSSYLFLLLLLMLLICWSEHNKLRPRQHPNDWYTAAGIMAIDVCSFCLYLANTASTSASPTFPEKKNNKNKITKQQMYVISLLTSWAGFLSGIKWFLLGLVWNHWNLTLNYDYCNLKPKLTHTSAVVQWWS